MIVSFVALLALLCTACEQTPGEDLCGNGVRDPGEYPYNCPEDIFDPCNHDGYCDPGESRLLCPDDGCGSCSFGSSIGAQYDFIIQTVSIPQTREQAAYEGVDLDGDGDIDNSLGVPALVEPPVPPSDISESVNQDIAAGRTILIGRITESGRSDGVAHVQLFRGAIHDATPVFDGNDLVRIHPSSDTDLNMCSLWSPPDLDTYPSAVTVAFPLPDIGLLALTLSRAQLLTVDDPDSPYYGNSSVDASGWTNVMVGGGLSHDEIHNNLIPAMADSISDIVAAGGSEADTLADLFDGGCVVLDDVPGCESVVRGEGECDDTADPPQITMTEVMCNALLQSALAPDVDSDGDGEKDLLSIGFRIVRAVPVTIVE